MGRGSGYAARQISGQVPRITANIPARWRLLQVGRDFPPTGTGPDPGTNRGKATGFLSRRHGEPVSERDTEGRRCDYAQGSRTMRGKRPRAGAGELSRI